MGECEAAHWVAVHQCWPWWRHLVDQSTSSTAHPADYMAKRLAFGTPSCLIWLAVSNPSLWRNTLSLVSIFCSPCPTGVSAGRWSCSSFPSPYRSLLIVIGIVSDVDVVHIVLDPETMPPSQPFISGWCATALTTLLGSEGSMLKLLFLIFSFVHSSGLASPKSVEPAEAAPAPDWFLLYREGPLFPMNIASDCLCSPAFCELRVELIQLSLRHVQTGCGFSSGPLKRGFIGSSTRLRFLSGCFGRKWESERVLTREFSDTVDLPFFSQWKIQENPLFGESIGNVCLFFGVP
jgi:hypothetical protein